jgi:hypothetical protein
MNLIEFKSALSSVLLHKSKYTFSFTKTIASEVRQWFRDEVQTALLEVICRQVIPILRK